MPQRKTRGLRSHNCVTRLQLARDHRRQSGPQTGTLSRQEGQGLGADVFFDALCVGMLPLVL